jgi:hypothetical protein
MYMQPLRCKVVGRTGSRAVAPAVPPRWCEGNSSACIVGAKQASSLAFKALCQHDLVPFIDDFLEPA